MTIFEDVRFPVANRAIVRVLSAIVIVLFCLCPLLRGESQLLKVKGFHNMPTLSGRSIRLRHVVPVYGRYLALVEASPLNEDEHKSWVKQYHGARMFSAVWFSKDWGVIETGETVYGFDNTFNPIPSDVDAKEIENMPAAQELPEVLVRDAMADDCPYIYGFPTKLVCLDEDLLAQRRKDGSRMEWSLSDQARGYLVIDGEIWVKSLYQGSLLNHFNLKTGKLDRGVLSVSGLTKALRKKVDSDDLSDLSEEPAKPNPELLKSYDEHNKGVEGDFKTLLQTPGSFQFDIAIDGKYGYLLLRRPLTVVKFNWPDGDIKQITPVTKGDLPSWAVSFDQIYIYSLQFYSDHPVAWFSVVRPLTFNTMRDLNPEMADEISKDWADDNPLTPDTVLGIDERSFGVSLTETRNIAIEMPQKAEDPGWLLDPAPFYIGTKGIWISGKNTRTGETGFTQIN